MKIKFLLLTAILAVVSCIKVENTFDNRIPTNSKGEYAISFNHPTKAQITSVSGTGYDEFKLFVWNSINDTIMKPYSIVANGESSYQYDEVDGQELQYFKRVADWYDFIGVIPTTKTMTLTDGSVKVTGVTSFIVDDKRAEKAVNLTDTLYWSAGLAAESPEEFLTAYRRVEKNDYGNIVELPFKHQNALIFLGFSSDQTDTKIIDYVPGIAEIPEVPGTPAVYDTTDTWVNLKNAVNAVATKLSTKAPGSTSYVNAYHLPDSLVTEIKSYYSVDNSIAGNYDLRLSKSIWDPTNQDTNLLKQLRVVKPIPSEYLMHCDMHGDGVYMDFFDAEKYLNDRGFYIDVDKPAVLNNRYVILDAYVNGTNYSITTLNWGDSNSVPQYTIEEKTPATPGTPAVPGRQAIEGIRVFSADSLGLNNLPTDTLYCVHVPHTVTADATIDANGCVLSNRATTDDVIQFSLPENITLSATPVWSPSTFYALPGDVNFNFIVVKLSYTYKGVTVYDVRVPIHLPEGGLQPGKYYKYELYITSTSNGTNDPDEAADEKDEILIEDNPVIQVKLIESGYTQGDERTLTI